MVDVTELAREVVLNKLLYSDDFDLMKTFEGLSITFRSGRKKDGLSKSKIDPCGVCSFIVRANLVLCMQCGSWIHGRCVGVRGWLQRKCEGNIVEAMGQGERLRDEVETVREFTYHGDIVSSGGECEATVTARATCGWCKFMECGELLYERRFALRLKGCVCLTSNSVWK